MISAAVILTLAMASVSARLYDLRTNTRLDAQFEFSLIGRGKVKATLPSGEVVSGSYVTAKNRTEFWGTLYGRNGGQVGGISQGTQYGTVEAVGDRGTTFLCEYVVVGIASGFGSCEDSRGGKYRLIFGGDAPEPPKAPPPSKVASVAGLTDGFRELRWGQPVPQGMVLFNTDKQATFYRRTPDEPSFAGVPVKATTYLFLSDRFAGAVLDFEPSSFPLLRKRLTDSWGSQSVRTPSGTLRPDTWYARNAGRNDTQAELNYSPDQGGAFCSLTITNWAVVKPHLDGILNGPTLDSGAATPLELEAPKTGGGQVPQVAAGAATLKDGFRDLRWGQPPAEGMVFAYLFRSGDDGAKMFTRPDDKLSLGLHRLSRIEYLFVDGKFAGAFLVVEESEACRPLTRELSATWGTPAEKPVPHRGETSYFWYARNSGTNDTKAELYVRIVPDPASLSEADRRRYEAEKAEMESWGTGCSLIISNPTIADQRVRKPTKSTIDKDL